MDIASGAVSFPLSSASSTPFFLLPSAAALSVDLLLVFLLGVAAVAFCLTPGGLAWSLSKSRAKAKSAIPGPSGLPILGLVFSFTGKLAHQSLAKLAKTFNAESLMSFSVGITRFVISSRPDTARELLNSSAFADRPVKESAYGLLFHRAMGFAPYGDYWRNLRRISSTHLFSPLRVSAFGGFRAEVGAKMVEQIKGEMEVNDVLGVKQILHFGSLNNVMKTVFGRSYDFSENGDGAEVEGLVKEGYELLGLFNWSDHFPLLGWMDLQGVRKRCRNLVKRVNVFVGDLIEQHRAERGEKGEENSHDFVHVLLDLQKENAISDSDMIAVLWEMIFRGTDTVAILLEWILARMVLHPDIQAKAQEEIDRVVGNRSTITDVDVQNLPYLQAIVKETLRVHPPGPLLSWARLAIEDTFIGSHFVPAGTTAMVNMYAITHDEKTWPEPETFKPERFLEQNVAIMGTDLRLAPFGAGRRVCPGKAMGLATAELWLAQLLCNFKWVAADCSGVDLSEVLNLSMEMKNPLVCKALSRAVQA